MTIRTAGLGDAPIVLELVRHFLEGTSYGPLLAYNPTQLAELFAFLVQSEDGIVFLADIGADRVAGLIALVAVVSPISRERFVEELVWFVEPEHRNGTVGPRLLREAEHWTRQKGVSVLKMVAPADTSVGVFYSRAGYTAVETAYVKRVTDGLHDPRTPGPRRGRRSLRGKGARPEAD